MPLRKSGFRHRCPTCDSWYSDDAPEAVKEHQHPEPQSGPLREAHMKSRLPYERWIVETPEGRAWAEDAAPIPLEVTLFGSDHVKAMHQKIVESLKLENNAT